MLMLVRTTGGAGGETVTVTSVEELQAAVAAEGPAIILVEGAITGGAKVDVSSDKTIIGKAGSCKPLAVMPPSSVFDHGTIHERATWDIHANKTLALALEGVGLEVREVSNVIIRNMKIGKVDADYGDAIRLYMATNVWVDHCDLYGDRDVGKDTYDGLVDLSHAADWVTVSHTYFHDHVSCPFCLLRYP